MGQAAGDPVQAHSCLLHIPVVSCLIHMSVDFALTSRDCADPNKNICSSAIIFCRAKSPPLWFFCWEGCCCKRLVFAWRWFWHGSLPDWIQSNMDVVVRRPPVRFTSEEPEDLSIAIKGLWHLYKYSKKRMKALVFSSFSETVQNSHEGLGSAFPLAREVSSIIVNKTFTNPSFSNWRKQQQSFSKPTTRCYENYLGLKCIWILSVYSAYFEKLRTEDKSFFLQAPQTAGCALLLQRRYRQPEQLQEYWF